MDSPWISVVREELLMIATHTTCQKRQWQRLFPRRIIIHHEGVSHPKNFASGRVHCICQFRSFIRKSICLVECPTCITFSHFWGEELNLKILGLVLFGQNLDCISTFQKHVQLYSESKQLSLILYARAFLAWIRWHAWQACGIDQRQIMNSHIRNRLFHGKLI